MADDLHPITGAPMTKSAQPSGRVTKSGSINAGSGSMDNFNPVTGAPLPSTDSPGFKKGAAAKALSHDHDPTWDPVTNQPKADSAIKRSDSFARKSETKKFADGSATKSGVNPISGLDAESHAMASLNITPKKTESKTASSPSGMAGVQTLGAVEYDPLTGAEKPRNTQAKVAGGIKRELKEQGKGDHQKNMEAAQSRKSTKGVTRKEVAANAEADIFGRPKGDSGPTRTGGTVKKEMAKNNQGGVGSALAHD